MALKPQTKEVYDPGRDNLLPPDIGALLPALRGDLVFHPGRMGCFQQHFADKGEAPFIDVRKHVEGLLRAAD